MKIKKWAPALVALFFIGYLGIHVSFAAFLPADNYLLACGSSQNVTFLGQIYTPDSVQSMFSMKSQGSSIAISSNGTTPHSLFDSARIFTTTTSYRFHIQQQGRHWIRLHFYLIPGHNLSSSSISVVTEKFVLLRDFSFHSYNDSYLFKEYSINVTSNSLSVIFIPGKNSPAFVNAIEVVSVPNNLIPDQAVTMSPFGSFHGISNLALETVYRLNMGGPLINPQNDTLGRRWENDGKYLHMNSAAVNVSVDPSNIKYGSVSAEIAPNYVYATAETMGAADVVNVNFNITWIFPVDPEFYYLLRVHFCDIVSKSMNDLIFNVYMNTAIAVESLDLSNEAGNLDTPYYRDFVSRVAATSNALTVSIGPDTNSDFINAIMNGLEIMKLSKAGSLSGSQAADSLVESPHNKNKTGILAGFVSLMTAILFAGFCGLCLVIRRSKETQRDSWLPLPLHGISSTVTKRSSTSQKSGTANCNSFSPSSFGRFFTFQEIMDATNKFNESLLLGVGGFGRVYKGTIEGGTKVAVKRGNPRSEQGLAEFRTEIEMLSKLRHRHLVSLIGYCDERLEMILVYEYMANGPLRSHLYGTDLPPLSWKQRLEICIGAARGLHYLHTGGHQSIIHRDVKTTNILLDENFVAKVADFGLSKTGPSLDQTHVSTAVKGSFGYLDPEYFRRQQLTEKSDVYSFGVVLMEVVCTRPALNPVLPRDQVNIAEWAMSWEKKGMLEHIMDKNLIGKVNVASLKKFGEIAKKCLADQSVDRPSMGDVLWNLEYALQLEEASLALKDGDEFDDSTNHIMGVPIYENSGVSSVEEEETQRGSSVVAGDEGEDGDTSAVFTQLVNPRGR